jgi:hypothetical protein
MIGDSFAKAAISAAIAIEQDDGDPTSLRGERADADIKEKINAAEAEARTDAEEHDLTLLNFLAFKRYEANLRQAASSALSRASGGSGDGPIVLSDAAEESCLIPLVVKLKSRSGAVPKGCDVIEKP